MRKVLCIITASIMILTMLSGCSVLQKLGLKGEDELQPVSSVVMNEDEAMKLTDKMPISLYFATEDSTKLKLEVRYVDMKEAKKSVNNLAGLIVKELIAGPKDSGLKATIPEGTQLLGNVAIDAKVATVNMSKEFVDKHPGGEAAARLTIYSVVNSLTEINEIEKVKFLVNGKSTEDFKGAYKLSSAFPRTVALISNEVGNAATAAKVNETAKGKATPAPQPGGKTAPTAQPGGKAAPTTQPGEKAAPTTQPGEKAAPTAQPGGKAAPTTQPGEKAAPTAQPGVKTTPAPQPAGKATPAPTVAPKATTAPKAAATPTAKPSTGKTSSNTQSLEDAEATYLEVLE